MLKLALANPALFRRLRRIPFARRLFMLQVGALPQLRDEEFLACVSSIRLPSGVYMATEAGRFADLDEITAELLAGRSDNRIHDVGVSTGITTLELLRRLEASQIAHRLYFSDRHSHFFIRGSWIKHVYTPQGEPVELYAFGVYGSAWLPWTVAISRILFALLKRPLAPPYQSVSTLDRRLRELLSTGRAHQFDFDVFGPVPAQRFTYVRCMNMLNHAYFTADELRRAVRTLMASLDEGGILQIGRTDEDTGLNRASFLTKKGDQLLVIREVGGGCDIKDVLEEWIASDPAASDSR